LGRGNADNWSVDAINSLVASTQRAQVMFDAAAERIASADLPTTAVPDPANPVAPQPSTDVDVAEQMITMMVAVDAHHASTAARRGALEMYQASLELQRP
jgi:flagellar basal body rod protein FlgC